MSNKRKQILLDYVNSFKGSPILSTIITPTSMIGIKKTVDKRLIDLPTGTAFPVVPNHRLGNVFTREELVVKVLFSFVKVLELDTLFNIKEDLREISRWKQVLSVATGLSKDEITKIAEDLANKISYQLELNVNTKVAQKLRELAPSESFGVSTLKCYVLPEEM